MTTKTRQIEPRTAIFASIVLFSLIYFGFSTKTDDQKLVEKSRALNFETISVPLMLEEARKGLNEEEKLVMSQLESQARNDTSVVLPLEQISGMWFDKEEWILAGHYATKVAERKKESDAWSVAGTTFAIALQRSKDEKIRQFAQRRAVSAFEKAISMDPDKVEYRINLAVTYAEKAPSDQPMKGILMLLDLEKQYPENEGIQTTLAHYGIQTGQWQKAEQRLIKVLEKNPANRKANCLMIQVAKNNGETDIDQFLQYCK